MAKKPIGKRIDSAFSEMKRLPPPRGGPETDIKRIGTLIEEVIAELKDPKKGQRSIHIDVKVTALNLLRAGVKAVCAPRWVIVHSAPKKDLGGPVARRRLKQK